MSYLVINEGLKTIAHNLWTRPIFGTDGGHSATAASQIHSAVERDTSLYNHDALGFFLSIVPSVSSAILNHFCNGTDSIDDRYFNSMYKITPKLSKKISEWCKEMKATAFTSSNIKGGGKINGQEVMIGNHRDELPNAHKNKASRSIGQKGALSTSTTYKKISAGRSGVYFIVYFTFDEDKIIDAKVLSLKPGKNPAYSNSFETKFIGKFKSVKKEEYIK